MDISQRRLELLDYVSTLLEDGSFTSTYKYALLIAMIDCSSEAVGAGAGEVAGLSVEDLAIRCIELYWRHVDKYASPAESKSGVLRQNNGKMPALMSQVRTLRERYGDRLAVSIASTDWRRAVIAVSNTLWMMPIRYLQNLQGEVRDRLYLFPQTKGPILKLREHVVVDLAALAPILRPMIQNAWAARVRRLNPDLTAHADSLQAFLFGSQRSSLAPWRRLMRELQGGRCMYCGARLTGEFPVDHFIPWAKYPADIAENLVGSCAGCNGKKSDHLAAEEHLERWCDRNVANARIIAEYCETEALLSSSDRVGRIAGNTYTIAERRQSLVWVHGSHLRPITSAWRAPVLELMGGSR